MLKFYKINKKIFLISLIGVMISLVLLISYPSNKIFTAIFATFMFIFLPSIIISKILNKKIEHELHAKQLEELKKSKDK